MDTFIITEAHELWAYARAKAWGLKYAYLIGLLTEQQGKCNLSGVTMLFEAEYRKHQVGRDGTHPLSPVLDHCSPGSDAAGHQIICWDFNHIKGSLPLFLFESLKETPTWRKLVEDWHYQAEIDPHDVKAFYRLLYIDVK